MVPFIWHLLRSNRVRTLLLLFSVLVVSAAFGLLLSAAETSKVTVDQDLADYWRTTYDILVRPPGYRSSIEEKYGLVQANHLSGIPGGITFEQYRAIRDIPGVEVAAPIAMLSYFDLRLWLDEAHHEKVKIRDPDFSAISLGKVSLSVDDNLRQYESVSQRYYYFLHDLSDDEMIELLKQDRIRIPMPPGERISVAPVGLDYRMAVLLAAIDPEQEARLVGLDAATEPTYFGADDKSEEVCFDSPTGERRCGFSFPVIFNAHSYVQATVRVDIWNVQVPAENLTVEWLLHKGGVDLLPTLPASLEGTVQDSHTNVYETWLPSQSGIRLQSWGVALPSVGATQLASLPSPVQYREIEVPWSPSAPVLEAVPFGKTECDLPDTSCTPEVRFRGISQEVIKEGLNYVWGNDILGTFDVEELSSLSSDLVHVPLETYYPPLVTLRYDEEGNPVDPAVVVRPTFHPESYIQRPPLVLTTLEAARLFNPVDPISAIRVRVSGIDRFSPEAQAKIEAVAAAIVEATGLDVDVVVGSSPRRVLVHVPGYEDIPPLGYVEEMWIQKGVTLSYSREVERVNVIFFALMLAVCTLNILNTTLTSVLSRHRETALQKALGWRSSTVFGLTLVEVGVVGLVAGGLGVLLARGLAACLSLSLPPEQALLILPLGIGLCLLGGLVPAWRAARVPPAVLLQRGEVSPDRRPLPGRLSLLTYGLRSLLRRRTRVVLMILTMTLATALLTVFLVASLELRGYLSATILGEYLVLRIKGHHYLMAGVCLLVAGLTTTDALLVSALERRREIGVLKAVGWRDRQVAGLFVREGLLLGLAGGVLGWLVGLAVYGLLYQGLPTRAWWVTLPALGVPVLVGAVAAWYPARQAARVPPAEAVRYE